MTSFFNALREWFGGSARGAANAAGPPLAAVKPTLRVSGAALTDTGPVRPANEDCVRCLLEDGGELGARVSLLIVADGMGGHQAGEVASQTVVDALSEDWHRRPGADVGQLLERAIRRAGAQVYAAASARSEWAGMGTTVVALAVSGDQAIVGHVGDSRAYLYRAGALRALSVDDTLVNHLLRTGAITEAQVPDHPDRGVLSQALGTRPQPAEVHISAPVNLQAGDLFLLCSDGVHDVLTDAVLTLLLSDPGSRGDLATLSRRVIQAAAAAGTQDNISVALMAVEAACSTDAAQALPAAGLRPTRPMNPTLTPDA
jgi:serine/threonine protein phosphatase PrpC